MTKEERRKVEERDKLLYKLMRDVLYFFYKYYEWTDETLNEQLNIK